MTLQQVRRPATGRTRRPAARFRFDVMGPLRVRRDGAGLDLGPVQQRVVLAVLLTHSTGAHANRPIARDRLIDAVWGTAAPRYAVNLVQKHMSRLRRVLDPQPVVWSEAGYLLPVADEDVDLRRFEQAVDRARTLVAGGEPAAAAGTLRTALAPWNGTFCDGLSAPLLDAERDRLAERRVCLIEERADLDLAVGGNPDLVAELRSLVTLYPVRERLRELLMRALYRAGRQADALTAYREARDHLREELGVEPGAPLRRLHEQMLAADPALIAGPPATVTPGAVTPGAVTPGAVPPDVVTTAAVPPVSGTRAEPADAPVPAELPAPPADFVGRRAELDRLRSMTGPATRPATVVVVTGTAGVGKTALVTRWAHEVRDQFPDGQLYLDLHGYDPARPPLPAHEAFARLLAALGVPADRQPDGLVAQAARYRSLVADRRLLVVLDNARDAGQVRPLLPGGSPCVVAVTSRNQLAGLVVAQCARPLTLDVLPAGESRALLAARLGTDRTAAEPVAVEEIADHCAHLPLPLSIVAGRAALHPTFPLASLAGELRPDRHRLDALRHDDPGTDLRTAYDLSYRALDVSAARLFRLLSLHPGPDVEARAAASLAGSQVPTAAAALTGLARASLLTEHTPGRFTMHRLLRVYSAERARAEETDESRDAALERLYAYRLRCGPTHP